MTHRLWGYAVFGAMLSAAGLPLYIHAPKFFVDSYGVELTALASVLVTLRLLDVVQDPVLGWLAAKAGPWRGPSAALAGGVMSFGMYGLFAVSAPISPLWWFALTLTLVFSGFSYLTILFYATGVGKARALGGVSHIRLARWRETGALLGVCLAAVMPTVLGALIDAPFAGFAVGFLGLSACALWAMRFEWQLAEALPATGFGPIWRDGPARRLLWIALLNAAPVAVSSTLFLFYVESRLAAPGSEGVLLLLFFVSAALSASVWGRLAENYGAKPVLLCAMGLAIVSFGGAVFLNAGDVGLFALVCIGSGIALGADLTLLPAIFARRMAIIAPNAAEGFALWGFVSKLTLAICAGALLPLLDAGGFEPRGPNSEASLQLLTILYAGLPCGLKLLAIALLARAEIDEVT